jgi:outer membrane receptor protein involved in Fe transport
LTESIDTMASNIGPQNSSARRLASALSRTTALVAPALAFASMVAPMAAHAADAPAGEVQAVVVTGSRIPQPNLTSDSPLVTVGQQDLKLKGVTTVENLLNDLPQVVGGQNLGQSINSTGTATVDLRGLGPKRTLVLVDGRRLPPGDSSTPVADLNNVPASLVDRVDLVTGGASAVYGADAVAGVVNFVMKHNFQGIQIDLQTSANQHDRKSPADDALLTAKGIAVPGSRFDGQQYTASIAMGVNAPDDKGNITAFGSYFNSQPVVQSQRDYSACGIQSFSSATASVYDTHGCAGSSNSAYGKFLPATNPGQTNPLLGIFNTSGKVTGFTTDPKVGSSLTYHDSTNGTNTFVLQAKTAGGAVLPAGYPYGTVPSYNFNNQSYLQRQDTRYNIGYFAHYQLNKHVDVYSDFMFMDDRTQAQYAPSGFFGGTGPVPHVPTFQINCNNPFLSSQQATALCGTAAGTNAIGLAQIGYRFVAADRNGDFRHNTFKVDLGARGEIDDVWSYDVYGQIGKSSYTQYATGYASLTKMQNALLVGGTAANPVCLSGGACVPLNIFTAQSSSISQAAFNYVLTPGITQGTTEEDVVSAAFTGDLNKYGVKSPFAADGVRVALGTEYRRENLVFSPDAESISGDLSGGSETPATAGSFGVTEVFGEAQIPLVSDKPFIKNLTFSPGYRFSDYTSVGNTETYKLDFSYEVNSDLRFRYTYNRAVRAPNVVELYAPQSLALYSGQDPCSGAPKSSLAKCALTGVTASQYGGIQPCPAAQCSTLAGGNPKLSPESADTYTFGVVLTPSFIPRFSLSVDYYNIRISNLISAGYGGAASTVSGCLAGNAFLCTKIHRDANGQLYGAGYVDVVNVNTGFEQTKGIDVSASYSQPLGGWGRLDIRSTGTYTSHFVIEPNAAVPSQGLAGSGTYDCAGLFGAVCSNPTPYWRSTTRFTWVSPWKMSASVNWRFIGATKVDVNQSNPLVNSGYGVLDTIDAKTKAMNYFDLSFQWKVKDGYTLRGGVNNVFDTNPPHGDSTNLGVYNANSNGNTYPGLYDTLGRNLFIGITANY